ncbi:MAG: pilus assembly protein [Anaerolineae bacterium]|jgi:pilus assembly protein Flp/PilA
MMFLPNEEGQGLAEYGMIIILAAIVVVLVLLLLGPAVGNLFSTVVDAF